MSDVEKKWTEEAKKLLMGRKIVAVRYMSKEEAEDMGWYSRGVVLQLDDGNLVFPSADDEGNNAGALFTNKGDLPVL